MFMLKSISMLLLSLTLLGSVMDLHNLARLPRLIEHYNEHRDKSMNFSFLDFLNLHYGSESERHDKEEHSRHTGLPFKAGDCTFAHIVTVPAPFQTHELAPLFSSQTYSNFYQSAYCSEFSQSIWQPPKNS